MGFALLIAGYFVFVTWGSMGVPFASDDMMNLAEHWRHGPFRMFYSNFLLWHDFYRPMGGVFYVPIFHFFGLNPLPYHIALKGLVLVLIALVYPLARGLGASALESWFAALIVAGHAGLVNLYFESSYIYDLLCAIFCAGALLCYVRSRSLGRPLDGTSTALFFTLFLCALNSKEMAVTLPVMLLAYEWLYHGPPSAGRSLRRFAIPGIAGAMTAVFLYGRVFRGLGRQPGYLVDYSLTRLLSFQQRQFQALFLQTDPSGGWAPIVLVWLAATYFAWRRNRPLLRFCWIWIVLTPLPLEFLEGRGGATLAVPLLGWAILGAEAALGLARRIAQDMEGEPGFGRLRLPARLALVTSGLVIAWAGLNKQRFESTLETYSTGLPTMEVIHQFEALNPKARPHSMVVFLNDPFDSWDMSFIAELWFRDRTVAIRLQKKTPLTPAQLARANYVFDWRGGRLIAVGGTAR